MVISLCVVNSIAFQSVVTFVTVAFSVEYTTMGLPVMPATLSVSSGWPQMANSCHNVNVPGASASTWIFPERSCVWIR